MMFSGSLTAQYVRSKSESEKFTLGIVIISFIAITVTSITIAIASENLEGYLQPETSTPADYFCHDGYTWKAYINVHFITMYFVETSGLITAMVQGIIATIVAVKKWGWWQRRRQRRGDTRDDEEQTTSDDESGEDDEDENDTSTIGHGAVEQDSFGNDVNDNNASINDRELQHVSGRQVPGGEADVAPGGLSRENLSDGDSAVLCDEHAVLYVSSSESEDELIDDGDPSCDGDSAVLCDDHAVLYVSSSESDDELIDDGDLQQEDPSCDDDIALLENDVLQQGPSCEVHNQDAMA
jgi:hypothetical protein